MARAQHAERKQKTGPRKRGTPLLEWLLGVAGMLLLAAGFTFLIHEGVTGDDRPGEITATVKNIVEAADMYVVTYTLSNAGSETVSNLRVSARLLDGEQEIETAHALIDYVPGHSRREGGFYFHNDPRRYTLDIRPEGYQAP